MTGLAHRQQGSPDPQPRARDSGALYVHFQSEHGVDHRTVVLSPRRARALRALWSWRGFVLVLAVVGSWVYFAFQSARVPLLSSRIAELQAEAFRIDTLQAELQALQQQYDQVQQMLGVTAPAVRDTETLAPATVRK